MGHFSIDADPEAIDRAATGYTELANHLATRATEANKTPGEITPQQWSGTARDAITTEMTALGGEMTKFQPMFSEAGQALKTLSTTVRTAKDTTIPSLNSRWDGTITTYNDAKSKADTAHSQDIGQINKDADSSGQQKKMLRLDADETRSYAYSQAYDAMTSAQGKLTTEYDTLVHDLETAFKNCGATLAAKTLVPVKDETVSAWVKGGGTGTNLGWTNPDGTPFPPQLGTRNLLGKDLALYDDRRAYEDAVRATQLGNAIKDKNHQPTKAELAELNGLLETNKDEKVFASEFMTGIGPRGLLELNGRIATLQGDNQFAQQPGSVLWDEDLAKTVGSLQRNLGFTLATATQDPGGENQVSWQWVSDLQKAGKEKFTVGWNQQNPEGMRENEVYGYQLLGPLLRNGTYGADFISEVGGDMVDFEMDQKGDARDKSGVWDNWTTGYTRLNWADGWGTYAEGGNDPVAALMVALGKSPEGSQKFFSNVSLIGDGGPGNVRYPRLDYLLTDREWPNDLMGQYPDDINDKGFYDYKPRGLDELGHALEAATADTSSQTSANLVSGIVWELTHDEQALGRDNGENDGSTKTFGDVDLIPPQLRDSMGNITANWMPSVHNALDGGERTPLGPGGDVDPYLPGVQLASAQFNGNDLTRFLGDVGKDEGAYRTVQGAEMIYAGAAYDSVLAHDPKNLDAMGKISTGMGNVFGILDYGAASAGHATAAEADGKHNDAIDGRFAVAGVVVDTAGGVIDEGAPVVGTALASGANKLLDAWKGSLYEDSTGQVNFDTGYRINNGKVLTEDLVSAAIARNTEPWPPTGPGSEQLADVGNNPSAWSDDDWAKWDYYTSQNGAGSTVTDASGDYTNSYNTAKNQLDGWAPSKN